MNKRNKPTDQLGTFEEFKNNFHYLYDGLTTNSISEVNTKLSINNDFDVCIRLKKATVGGKLSQKQDAHFHSPDKHATADHTAETITNPSPGPD